MHYKTLDDVDLSGKRVLVRVDFNVPMQDGRISDVTRLERAVPTIKELCDKGAKVILLSHFGRPAGRVCPEMSLAPLCDALSALLDGQKIAFVSDCVGPQMERAVNTLENGAILLAENVRFHVGEEQNDPAFAKALAAHADVYVNDAFSAAHRAHASTHGVAQLIPALAGRSLQRELDYLSAALADPTRPMMAVVGGAKVSTKLDVLTNLIHKADQIVVGGGMANTFLLAMGMDVGASLVEADLVSVAQNILDKARQENCEIVLPKDVVVATQLCVGAKTQVKACNEVAPDEMILDLGPDSVDDIAARLEGCKTLCWNGPLGAFETEPFHVATVEAAKFAAKRAQAGALIAVAGGGDTVAALNMAGVVDKFTYVSTAGGAFLEWMEGKNLPGVAALCR